MTYLKYTNNLLTSSLFIFPFLIIYEFLAFFKFKNSTYQIRNTADIILRDIVGIFSSNVMLFYSFLLLIIFLFFLIFKYEDIKKYKFNLPYISIMYIEGIIFGIILVFLLNGIDIFNFNITIVPSYDYSLLFYFCIGAAIWEEILFRLILINLFFLIFKKLSINNNCAFIVSITFSSVLFSLFHYIGTLGDTFSMYSFIYRFVGGLYLSILYYYRGIGISMMSHFIYDFLLITIPEL
mgnify:CR=1 FL=1